MADVTPLSTTPAKGAMTLTWSGLVGGNTATGLVVALPANVDSLTFHGYASNWDSLSMSLQGSNVTEGFVTLSTPTGGAATLTANGVLEIEQKPRYVKIALTTGTTNSNANAVLLVRGRS